MATRKTTSAPRSRRRTGGQAPEETPTQSAQKVWLAGLGALGRAQAEGSRLFETLVHEGMGLQRSTRKVAAERAESMREAMQSSLEGARMRAGRTWERLEGAFEDQVQRALQRLKVPTQDDLDAMAATIASLQAQLRGGSGSSATPRRKAPASAGKSSAKPAATGVRKTASRTAPRARKTAPKSR